MKKTEFDAKLLRRVKKNKQFTHSCALAAFACHWIKYCQKFTQMLPLKTIVDTLCGKCLTEDNKGLLIQLNDWQTKYGKEKVVKYSAQKSSL